MASQRPARERAGESISEFMGRRRQEVATASSARRAAAHEAYGTAIRQGHELSLHRPADLVAHGAQVLAGSTEAKLKPHNTQDWTNVGHPGMAESFVPVWGSGREALADWHEGKPVSAGFNAGMAALDISLLAGLTRKLAAKGGLYVIRGAISRPAAEANWKRAVRPKLGELGILKPKQHGHHWFIPQKSWGRKVPEVIKNHPMNIKAMPSPEVHGRLTGPYKGKPQYGLLGQIWHGTPHWSKATAGSAVGHGVAAGQKRGR